MAAEHGDETSQCAAWKVAHGEKEAERLLRDGLAAAGLKTAELDKLAANEKRKVAVARVIWRQTTVSQGWIAERLRMKNAANVSLSLHRKANDSRDLPEALGDWMQENAA